MAGYLRPTSLDEALAALKRGPVTVVAGGTDYYPARVGRPLDGDVLDISAVRALRGIEDRGDHWRIGACTTWRDVARAGELPPCFDGLRLAAREVGGVQIQNAGTVGGNLCNASPAADGVPPLLSLDARVELSSADGIEAVPLAEFVLGNRRTARRPDQLLAAVLVPKPATPRSHGHFLKLGARRYLVISIVMVGAVVETGDDGRVTAARVAVGACSEIARRLPTLEGRLVGRPADAALGGLVEAGDLAPLAPIDDVRADAAYRLDAALTLVRRTLAELGARSAG
ncbi:MAG TPA: FAD binding domain-containing protein [Geminicoccaceae bacterium]|nr:FAD binding domain-containing protein [Geminicoccaceae bacterium]